MMSEYFLHLTINILALSDDIWYIEHWFTASGCIRRCSMQEIDYENLEELIIEQGILACLAYEDE